MLLLEDKNKRKAIVYNGKQLLFYSFIVPDALLLDFGTDRLSVYLSHSEPYKIKKVRGKITLERLEKEMDKE